MPSPGSEIFWTLIVGTMALLTLAVVFIATIILNQRRFITIEREKLNALQQSEHRFRSLIENSFDALVLVDADGMTIFASQSTERVLGYTVGEFLQRSLRELIVPEDFENLTQALAGRLLPGERAHFQFRARHKNGSLRWLEGVATNLLSEPAVGAVVINYRDITERKQAEENIKNSRDQLRQLSARLQTAREEERTHIAREIHDELGQMMTVLKLDLALLARDFDTSREAVEAIQSMSSIVDDVIHSVRRIATELRPEVLEHLGLIDAFEWELETLEKRTGIKGTFVSDANEVTLERDRMAALFRIFQEALTNVARHSRAKEVNVNVCQENGELIVQIRDNGRGISAEEASGTKSLGLLGMRERALMIGGEILVTGEKDQGTLVRVKVPLDHRAI